jgi:hypothetical protein
MDERGISDHDALKVLRIGSVEGDITAGNRPGEWCCKMVANIRGSRDIGIVTVVINSQRISVKTVEWEDLR